MSSSRRDAVLGAFAFIGISSIATNAKAEGRQPKRTVAFQNKPKRAQKCATCKLFRAADVEGTPSKCLVIAGEVTASSWCVLWEAPSD